MNALKTHRRVVEEEQAELDRKHREEYDKLSDEEKKKIREKTQDLLSFYGVVNSMTNGAYNQ